MKSNDEPTPVEANEEIPRLIETLHAVERRLAELTHGEVDTVADAEGRPFLLRRAQEQLRYGEADKQAAILDALPAHIALLDAEGFIVSVNQAWRRFGQANGIHGPASGLNYLDVCERARGNDAGMSHEIAAGIRSVLQGDIPKFSIEYPCHSPTEQCWFQLTATPLSTEQRKGAVVMHVNVSERRRAEGDFQRGEREQHQLARELIVEKERLLEAQAVAKVGSWETDLFTLTVVWSAETHRIFETDSLRFQPTHAAFLERVHPLDRAAVDAAFLESLYSKAPYAMEHRLLLPDGREKSVEQRWRSVFSPDGKPIRVSGTCQDITDRKQAMEALRLSEKRFKALFDQAAVGVAQTDATTGRFLQINLRFCEILGRSRQEMETLTFSEIIHAGDVDRVSELMQQMRRGSLREFTQEKRYVRKDGSDVWANVTISAMWAPGEPPDYFLVFGQDVTERKRLEDQFRQAQKMDAIGTLAGGIAHDFNNILAAINGYAELSRVVLTDNPEVRDNLGAILKAANRAASLVRQILTFSRQQPLERRPVELLPVVAESLMLLRATLPSTIEFETSLPTDAPTVLADATQIHQVLMNLGTNAWHAMKGRPGRLKVSLERCVVDSLHAARQTRMRSGVYARISFTDTGTGMPPATLRRIFEPFFTTKPHGEGTGLGLAVVHGIMDSHEGAIEVYSQPGEGTVFHLYFPAHTGEVALAAPEENSVPRGRGERILIVDDEEMLVKLGRKALTGLGYQTEGTTEPEVAVALIQSDPDRFALVITDQTMPKMTGLDLAARLLQIRPALPIILSTGYSQTLTTAAVEAVGIRQLLLKPFSIQTLGNAVHAALFFPVAAVGTERDLAP